jgi:hypothetical protein
MYMKKVGICLFALALALPIAASAAPHQKPGRWEVTTEMEMPGMPMKMPPVVTNVCLTQEDVDNPERTLPKASRDKNANCKVSDFKTEGNTVTWNMACEGATPMTGSGQITYGGDTYDGAMKMKIKIKDQDQEMTMHFKGKFNGECDGTEMNKKK